MSFNEEYLHDQINMPDLRHSKHKQLNMTEIETDKT